MTVFDGDKVKKILDLSNIGLWRVEFEEGKPPRFYADAVMDELLGIEKEVTPEERFAFHHAYIHPDDQEMFEEYSHKLAEERTEVSYRYLHPTRGEMFVRCGGVKDPDTKGYLGFYGTHQNISDTVRFEKEKLAEARLAEAVYEKERALKKAKRASAAKSEFLARMSHDIRTPLNGIIGLIEIGEAHAEDIETLNANRAKAKVAADHLLSLINDVLDMSKLEDDNIELPREKINIRNICNEVMTISNIRARENGITLQSDTDKEIVYEELFGSSLHIKQILLNLVNNSIKYNRPNGSIHTKTTVVSADEDHVTYRFSISDTGIGMSAEFLKHIFEPFTQEKTDARSRYQGTGMGMAIVKRLVDMMHGTISIQSEVGVGTTFDVEIPFEINHEASGSEEAENVKETSIKGLRILMAEDNELNREIANCMLEDAGAMVTNAVDGQETVEIFEKNPAGSFDAILMDIMMPRMDGYAATMAIRSSSKADAESIPIIAMTANAFAEDVQKAKEAGMNAHLSKPIRTEALIEKISRLAN